MKKTEGIKMTLYELTQEQLFLYEMLSSGSALDIETGEIDPVVAERLEINGKDLDEKIKAVGIVYKQLLSDAKALKDEEETLAIRRKRTERNAELIKNRLQNSMIMLGRNNFKDSKLDISFRKSTKTEIINEAIIPEEYLKIETTKTPLKAEIKTAIQNGVDVPGAIIVETQNIQIK